MSAIPTDWLFGLAGGLMIGLAAALYLLVNGRIMGASGILGGLLDGADGAMERAAFVIGLIGAPAIVALAFGPLETGASSNPIIVAIGGVLVGLGTRMANGCTSGHGVCGLSRFSLRGLAATLSFLAAGMAAMALLRHGLGVI